MRLSLRHASIALAAVSLSGVAALTPIGAAHASPWTGTATKAVTYKGAALGATPAATPLHLTLTLTPRNAAAMTSAVHAMYTPGSATYHHYLTAAQWRARYAPSTASVRAVAHYLSANGFSHVTASANHLSVSADGSAAQAEQAFHTALVSYRHGSHAVYGNSSAASVPADLQGVVSSVVGLNDLPLNAVKTQIVHPATKAATPAKAGSPSTGGLFPTQFRTTYDAVGTKSGTKTTIAVLSEGATKGVISSLRYAEAKEHAKKVKVKVVKVGAQSTDVSGADEFDMDTQASTIMAGSVKKLYLYNIGSLADSEIVAAVQTFVSDDQAQAMSASIGGCEYNSFLDGSELAVDVAMQEGALQGQSLLASSGDEGDACAVVANTGTPAGVPQVEWPASGEFDLSVGGTSLVSDAKGNRIQELAWLGGGGGVSEFELPGWWTQDTDTAYTGQYVTGGRAVPDVALDADPNVATPVKVYVGTKVSFVGGTSLSSPLMLGIWARLESVHHNKLGLAGPALYKVYDKINPGTTTTVPEVGLPVVVPAVDPKKVPGFTDIILGSDGAYQAAPGWDFTTGLGAPDVKKLVAVIGK